MNSPAHQRQHWYNAKQVAEIFDISTVRLYKILQQGGAAYRDKHHGHLHATKHWQEQGLLRADQRQHKIPANVTYITKWYTVIQVSEKGLAYVRELVHEHIDKKYQQPPSKGG